MYTSGTTGRPKGAVLTHDNMLWNAINMLSAGPGIASTDVTIAAAPLFHIGALGPLGAAAALRGRDGRRRARRSTRRASSTSWRASA